MMKTNTIPSVLATFASVLISTSVLHADQKTEKRKSSSKSEVTLSTEAIEAMEKSGIDPEILKQVKKAMESGKSGSVSVSTTVIGPDGKVITQSSENGVSLDLSEEGQKKMTLDLGKLISEATAAAGGASEDSSAASDETSVSASISGKVMIVGEDGKVQTHSIGDGLGSDALEKALGEALRSIDIKVLDSEGFKKQAQVFGFGPATIEGGDVSDRLKEIENELKEQRRLLEKILKKL